MCDDDGFSGKNRRLFRDALRDKQLFLHHLGRCLSLFLSEPRSSRFTLHLQLEQFLVHFHFVVSTSNRKNLVSDSLNFLYSILGVARLGVICRLSVEFLSRICTSREHQPSRLEGRRVDVP